MKFCEKLGIFGNLKAGSMFLCVSGILLSIICAMDSSREKKGLGIHILLIDLYIDSQLINIKLISSTKQFVSFNVKWFYYCEAHND